MENNTTGAGIQPEQAQQPQGQVRIQKIYVKDVSLETPNSPGIFMSQTQTPPQVDFQLNMSSTTVEGDMNEVVLGITVTVKMGDKTAFLVEVQQAGLFLLTGFQPSQLHYMRGAFCPNILYPYARETVSDMVTRSGFPPLLLDPVNFDALYAQQVQKARDQQQQNAAGQVNITATSGA